MSLERSEGPWKLLAGNCAVMLGVVNGKGRPVAMLGHRDAIRPADAAAIVQADALATACAMFDEAARAAVRAFNDAGLACPSSIAFAAELARNALADMHRVEAEMAGKSAGART